MTYSLWEGKAPGPETELPLITPYLPKNPTTKAAVLILPGGGYAHRAAHEGEGYAQKLNEWGVPAFVLNYRVDPARFPAPLLDARRAMRYLRAHAAELAIDPDRIAVMGSSAGGHLGALLSTYRLPLEGEGVDELDAISPYPNLQILCYPVISADEAIGHMWSFRYLLGEENFAAKEGLSADRLVDDATPPAFIWHTAADKGVNVCNSYRYATALREHDIPCEMHIFPFGAHGLGLAPAEPHIAQWSGLLRNFLTLVGYLPAAEG